LFWKKKPAAAQPPKPKAKELSPKKDVITNQIERLGAGQTLRYRVPEEWGGDLVVIELNPQYPKKGRKYMLSTEKLVDGKPAGKELLLGILINQRI